MRYGIAILVMITALPAWSGEWSAGIAYSSHYEPTYSEGGRQIPFASIHPAIGYYGALDAYLFRNSFGDPTLAVGHRFSTELNKLFDAELYLSGSFGYSDRLKYRIGDVGLFGWVGITYQPGDQYSLQMKATTDFAAIGVAVTL